MIGSKTVCRMSGNWLHHGIWSLEAGGEDDAAIGTGLNDH
jgi:hypothetical protein